MAAVALGALALGLVRLAIAHRVLADRGRPAHGWLQAIAEKLAERLGTPRPQVLVCPLSRPLALASGLRRPTILLSTWTLDHLDRREIEAVLAHELGHIAHRDCPAAWLASVLRDAFCYLPASRAAYQHLQHEKELACDDLAVHITHRPLALASALAKVWQPGLAANRGGTLQPFEGAAGSVEERIERLLAYTAPSVAPGPSPRRGLRSLRLAAPMLASMAGLQAASVALFLAPMGCGPAVALANVL
jgi:Zn-dependent protease with chaperone function